MTHQPTPDMQAPIRRTFLRRRLGRVFYRVKRRLKWMLGGIRFARQKAPPLSHLVFQHQSPLLRSLKGVDMYLQYNKATNLRLAAEKINGIILQPGDTFSFWRLVGRPSAGRGFLEGLVLENGRVGKGIGGGLCQMGNLLYWMALHSPLSVVERWRHSYDVFPDEGRTLPFGSGATLAWNYLDLQLKNDSDRPFQLCVWLSESHLQGEIRSVEPCRYQYTVIEKDHMIRHQPWGGYSRHNRLLRQTLDAGNGQVIAEQIIAENHALMMYQPFLKDAG